MVFTHKKTSNHVCHVIGIQNRCGQDDMRRTSRLGQVNSELIQGQPFRKK